MNTSLAPSLVDNTTLSLRTYFPNAEIDWENVRSIVDIALHNAYYDGAQDTLQNIRASLETVLSVEREILKHPGDTTP